jgi:hypothetical protein
MLDIPACHLTEGIYLISGKKMARKKLLYSGHLPVLV